jgi:uncharacterized protein YfdQ (DUF2303 family)
MITICKTGMTAWLDYHDPSTKYPGRNLHRAHLSLAESVQSKAWKEINGIPLNQEKFAEFLEEHSQDVRSLDAATLMEIVLTLQGKSEVSFRKAVRLNSGTVQVCWDETASVKAGQHGELDVPTGIVLAIPLFEYGESVTITAKLRTVVRDGGVTFSVKLLRLDIAIEDALRANIETVKKGTEITPLIGTM